MTTTLGLVLRDGVILATDMRATAGYFISHKHAQKLFKIDDHLGATIAGRVADAQQVMDWAQVEASLYKLQRGVPMPVRSAARLIANILFQSRYMPYYLQSLIAGVDSTGPHLFILDLLGNLVEEKSISTGSGSPFVFGLLEDQYDEGMTVEEGKDLAVRAVHSAMERDAASGDGIAVAVISAEKGFTPVSEDEIKQILNGSKR
ncbi:archaeal proteasome endopeptidase complex subunit beta [Candidatus Borrarchaeum sp.]|uniref:archaeal proteasome endopeptidase complex subunit beta n=1 Tax=Candidatus Borrarchaeum sp. TaxID=2846742 RepID=UPI00257FE3C5|nr:archaeal proteasome endopeptidase complex subunit beta [Candidatus Borrarchaeum sp.]